MTTDDLSFGQFHFDPAQRLLFCDGEPVPLGRRALLLLDALLRRRGEVVRKDELIEAAWPGEAVEESNLSVQVAQLRKRIGGTWIRTVERVGYVFAADTRAPSSPAVAAHLPGIAILPFIDFSGYAFAPLGGALVEEVITSLARFRSVTVAARSSSFQFEQRPTDVREIASILEVRYVIEGSIRRSGDQLRLGVQLIDGESGVHLWADSLDRKSAHGLIDTTELAGRAAAMIEAQVHLAEIDRSRHERPQSTTTRDLYLRARFHLSASRQDGHAAAYALLTEAMEREPENVDLLVAAAEALHHGIAVGWPPLTQDDRKASLELAKRGVYLGATDGAALGIFSNAMFTAYEHDLGGAVMERAVDINPNSSLALVCAGLGYKYLNRLDDSEDLYTRALAFGPGDPNRKFALTGLAAIRRQRGDDEGAVDLATRSLALNQGFSGTHWILIAANARLGRLEAARRHLARYRAIAPGVTVAAIRDGVPAASPHQLDSLLEGLWQAGLPEA